MSLLAHLWHINEFGSTNGGGQWILHQSAICNFQRDFFFRTGQCISECQPVMLKKNKKI